MTKELRPATNEELKNFTAAVKADPTSRGRYIKIYAHNGIEINNNSNKGSIVKQGQAKIKAVEQEVYQELKDAGCNFDKFTKDQVKELVQLVFNGITPNEAMLNVGSLSGKDTDWVRTVGKKPHRKQMRHALGENKEHPTMKDLTSIEHMTRTDKAHLCISSLNSSLNTIKRKMSFLERLQRLEQNDLDKELRIQELEARLSATTTATNIVSATVLDKKAMAKQMLDNGVKQVEVAKHFGVSDRTIRTWVK